MKIRHLAFIIATLAATPVCAQQLPGEHPAYLHALSDLREARWMLYHTYGDHKIYANEDRAISEIDIAIREIKHAAVRDGKDIGDRPAPDAKQHGSRLLKALEALDKARRDISKAEDNPQVRGLRARALGHIDAALSAAHAAHKEWIRLHS